MRSSSFSLRLVGCLSVLAASLTLILCGTISQLMKPIKLLRPFGFKPQLNLPATSNGWLDHEQLYTPVVDRIRQRVSGSLLGLDTFEYAYPSHGSTEALGTLLSRWHAVGKFSKLAVVDGEYAGYRREAEDLGIEVVRYADLDAARQPRSDELWFVSNPSARDGNLLDDEVWSRFVSAGHQIVLDTAYLGLTDSGRLDVSPPNINAVVSSPSKELGVFHYRGTGVTYTHESIRKLDEGARFFQDVPALLQTLALRESVEFHELPRHYRENICQALSEVMGVSVEASDTLTLAYATDDLPVDYRAYRRGNGYRFGLAPLFESVIYGKHETIGPRTT